MGNTSHECHIKGEHHCRRQRVGQHTALSHGGSEVVGTRARASLPWKPPQNTHLLIQACHPGMRARAGTEGEVHTTAMQRKCSRTGQKRLSDPDPRVGSALQLPRRRPASRPPRRRRRGVVVIGV